MAETPETVLEKLKIALSLVETLQKENEAFKDNFECLKNSHERLQERYETLTREYDLSVKEKAALESQNTEITSYFKAQLEERTKELDDFRTKAPQPKDLEILRLKVVQEMEDQNERRWKGLSMETEKYRSLYYNLRRDHEVAKADIDRERAQMEARLKEMEHTYQGEMTALEARMLQLRQSLDTTIDTKRLRELQRDNADLQLKAQSLLSELEELRAEKEKLHLDLEQQSRLHKRKLTDEVSHAKTLQAEKEALLVKITTLETESTQALRTLDQVTEQNTELTKELDKTRSRLEETLHNFKVETTDLKLNMLKEKNQYENTINDLKEKGNQLESQAKSATETIQSLRERVSYGEKDLLEKLRMAREEEWANRTQLEIEKSDLEKQLSDLKQRTTETESLHESAKKDLHNELNNLKQTLRTLTTQNDTITNAHLEANSQVERLQSEIQHLKTALNNVVVDKSGLEKEVDVRRKGEESLREQLTKADANLALLQAELTQTTEQMEKEREAYFHNTERYKTTWAKEKAHLTHKLDTVTKDKEKWSDKAKDLEELLDKSQTLFKNKLQTVKTRAKEYREEVHRLRARLEHETKRADAIEREMHKRQTNFLGLLRTEGVLETAA